MKRTTFSTGDLWLLAGLTVAMNLAFIQACLNGNVDHLRNLVMLLMAILQLRLFRHLTDGKQLSIGPVLYFAAQNSLLLAGGFLLFNSALDYMELAHRAGGAATDQLSFFCNDLYIRIIEKWDDYLWLLGLMMAALLVQTLWRSNKDRLRELHLVKFLREAMAPEDLEFFIKQFQEHENFNALYDYCDAMEPGEKTKKELTACIERYDLRLLYNTLFEKCGDLLTEEETAYYNERYHTLFETEETEEHDHE